MAHRIYLWNVDGIADRHAERVAMVEWNGEFPCLLSPLLAGSPFLARNGCNDTGEADGIYASAEEGKALMAAFYALLGRHAPSLVDDLPAFRKAARNILAFLANRAVHRYFHLDGWDRFNLSEGSHPAQAVALMERIQHDNACIRAAIEADDPSLLEACEGWRHEEAASFRALLNASHYGYGWEALTSAIFEEAEIFEEDGRLGLRSVAGEPLLPTVYDEIGEYDAWGIAIVRQGGCHGYVDKEGRPLTPVVFEQAEAFRGAGYATVVRDGKFGAIELDGRQALSCRYEALETFDGRAGAIWAAREGESWGVVDRGGNWRLPPIYERIEVETGTIFAKRAGQSLPEAYTRCFSPLGVFAMDELSQFEPKPGPWERDTEAQAHTIHYWPPGNGEARPLLDENGAVLLALDASDTVEPLHDTPFYIVRMGGRFGLFHAFERRWALPCTHGVLRNAQDVTTYEDRQAGHVFVLVEQDGRWGLYQAAPEPCWPIPPAYDELQPWLVRWLSCREGGRWGMVHRQGHLVHPPRYASLLPRDPEGPWVATAFRDGGVFALLDDGAEAPLSPADARDALASYDWLAWLDVAQRQALERAAAAEVDS